MTPLTIALSCVFLQVGLTFWSVMRMGQVRVASLQAREVKLGEVALETTAYPDHVKKYQNNASNQFQTPQLLYGVVALAAALDAANWGLAVGAVIYVAARLAHRVVHVGSNNVRVRFNAYLVGLTGVFIAWISLGVELLGII